ncbi:MAG: peptidylprolyl isomerase [Acidobacteriota bacterium]
MRDSMPAILIGLVVVFLITIVFEWGMDYVGIRSKQHDTIGVIDGKKISNTEFSELVKRQADQQKMQTRQEPDENAYRMIREQVWNSLVTQTLVEQESERAGIKVSDQEIVDWVRGENPPEFLAAQFRDSTGRFNRAAYENALADPRNKDIWVQVEDALKQQRLAEKMQSVVLSTVRATPGEVEQRFMDQNLKVSAEYAFFDPNTFVPDAEVKVTDDDLKKYYNDHQAEFKNPALRKLKYVFFNDQPSSSDSSDVMNEVNSVVQQAKTGTDFTELQKKYSEGQTEPAVVRHGETTPAKEKAIFAAKVGDIIGPINDVDGIHLMKVVEEKPGEVSVKARHILLDGSKEAASMTLAKELVARAKKGEDFAALARQYSTEPGAAGSGGDLGWFGKGRMVKEFEDAALKGKPGDVIGPVKTQFGIHVIKIEGRESRELKVADILMTVKASGQTRDAAFQRAQDFAYVAKDGKFEKDAESFSLKVQETPEFQKGTIVPGLGYFEALNKFAFKGDLGDVSEVFNVSGGYVVATISEVKKEGVRPFDEVKQNLQPRVLYKMKVAKLKELAGQKRSAVGDNGDLRTLASGDPRIKVDTTGSFAYGGGIPGIGRDFAFAGAAKSLEIGKVSQPIEGARGVYLVKVLSRPGIDKAALDAQRAVIAAQIQQEKKQRAVTAWLEKAKEKAKIEDNRDQFYR